MKSIFREGCQNTFLSIFPPGPGSSASDVPKSPIQIQKLVPIQRSSPVMENAFEKNLKHEMQYSSSDIAFGRKSLRKSIEIDESDANKHSKIDAENFGMVESKQLTIVEEATKSTMSPATLEKHSSNNNEFDIVDDASDTEIDSKQITAAEKLLDASDENSSSDVNFEDPDTDKVQDLVDETDSEFDPNEDDDMDHSDHLIISKMIQDMDMDHQNFQMKFTLRFQI